MKKSVEKNKWEVKKLGDLVELKYGFGLREIERNVGEIPVFGSSGIISYTNKSAVRGPGIVVGRKGNIGSVFFSSSDFWPIDTTYYIEVNKNCYDLKFLLYLFKTLTLVDTASAVPGLSRESFYNVSAKIPPLPTQQKIASILSAYDDLIELNERRIKILEEMARLIYKEWFVKFKFPGHERVNPVRNTKQLPQDSKISNGVKMVKSELGMIPEGWEAKGIFDIATVRYGENLPSKKMKKNGTYLVYGAAKVIGRYDEYNCENATVITGCRGSCGQMKITKPKSFVTNNSFIFDFSEEQKIFFYHQLMTHGLQDYIGGTAQPQITLESISGLTAMVPMEKLVKRFNEIAIPISKQINLFDDVNTNLRQTRDMLLPKLISGEIDVSDLDIKVNQNA